MNASHLTSLPETADERFGDNGVFLSLRDHKIQTIIPPHSLMRGELLLSGGVVIYGTFCGRLICAEGSVIIMDGAVFEGELEADQVWVDGTVQNVSPATATLLALLGRTTPTAARPAASGLSTSFKQKLLEGGLSRIVGRDSLAISNAAKGRADAASKNFAVHGRGFAARYVPL